MITLIKLTDAFTSANNKQEKKKQPRSYPNKKLVAILLLLFGGAALTPGIAAVKGAQNESYPADPAVVYTDFKRGSEDPDQVHTHTAFIPVNIKDTDRIRLDFYQGERIGESNTRLVFLAEVSFFE